MSPQPGRPRLLVAVDIGGTKTVVATAAKDSGPHDGFIGRRLFQTPKDADSTLRAIVATTRRLTGSDPIAGIGVSFGGQVSNEFPPRLRSLVIPGWESVDLPALFAAAFDGAPTRIVNDGEAAARAEYLSLAAVSAPPATLVYITVSTGVGGAVLFDGRVHRGHHGLAAEIGHLPVRPDGRCPCGRTGHLEAHASGPAIAHAARAQLAATGRTNSPLRMVLTRTGTLTARDVALAARQGDNLATEVLGQAGSLVGRAVALVATLLDPEVVIIGGGVAQAGDPFWSPLLSTANAGAMHPLELQPAAHGPHSALLGALALASEAELSIDKASASRSSRS